MSHDIKFVVSDGCRARNVSYTHSVIVERICSNMSELLSERVWVRERGKTLWEERIVRENTRLKRW